MKIIDLPLLYDSEPALEAARLGRENRFSGVVSTDGEHFWLHRFSDIMAAVTLDPVQPLKQAHRIEIQLLHTLDAASGGLDLVDPNPAVIDSFLKSRGNEFVICGLTENPRTTGREAHLLMLQDVAGFYISVTARSYRCSKGNEVIDEDKLPVDFKCRRHKNGVFIEQP